MCVKYCFGWPGGSGDAQHEFNGAADERKNYYVGAAYQPSREAALVNFTFDCLAAPKCRPIERWWGAEYEIITGKKLTKEFFDDIVPIST